MDNLNQQAVPAKKPFPIAFNSPVILTFSLICLIALILSALTGGDSNALLFSVYRSSPKNPFTYIRLIGHVFGHAGWEHFLNNITMILVIGPMLEEKYGSKEIIFVILITALVTGLVHILFFPTTGLLGASGVVFAFILLAPMTSFKKGTVPLTFIIVAIIYIGGQVYSAVTVDDNISNLTHIVGGLLGALYGYLDNFLDARSTNK